MVEMQFLQEQKTALRIQYAVLGFGFLRRSTSYIHVVVRAGSPRTHEKITIFRGTFNLIFSI